MDCMQREIRASEAMQATREGGDDRLIAAGGGFRSLLDSACCVKL